MAMNIKKGDTIVVLSGKDKQFSHIVITSINAMYIK